MIIEFFGGPKDGLQAEGPSLKRTTWIRLLVGGELVVGRNAAVYRLETPGRMVFSGTEVIPEGWAEKKFFFANGGA